MQIGLTSQSKHKRGAVVAACHLFKIKHNLITENASSDVNAQPFGFNEMIQGAESRIKNSGFRTFEDMSLIFSIENGIILTSLHEVAKDFACVIVETHDGRKSVNFSQSITMPLAQTEKASRAGFESRTVGSFLKEDGVVKDATDPHFELGGRRRSDILMDTVCVCLHELGFRRG